jgi:23S rRNA (guanosine2251-2'-O)-methyltransferase
MNQRKGPRGAPSGRHAEPGTHAYWLYGRHPVLAALGHAERRCRRLLAVEPPEQKLEHLARERGLAVERVRRDQITPLVPGGAPHQGLALLAEPLPPVELAQACAGPLPGAPVVVLDQVTDPHNVGAILRSAAAFNARAVVMTETHGPPETGVLARAASGALDLLPLIRVGNLARALDELAELGYWRIGLAETAVESIDQARQAGRLDSPLAVVLGAEGTGMRRLTAERCDFVLRLPTGSRMPSLNVSNAAAIALYELARMPPQAST